eukprot:7110522-Prymnesium_polylepis.1
MSRKGRKRLVGPGPDRGRSGSPPRRSGARRGRSGSGGAGPDRRRSGPGVAVWSGRAVRSEAWRSGA